jgi:predicted RNA-binding Zn-ribbon protein involved in translation (DUF1610 family)
MKSDSFARVPTSLLEDARITSSIIAVFAALSSYTNSSLVCFPSIATISRRAHLSENAVRNTLKRLKQLGYITVTQRRNGARQGPNVYTLYFQPTLNEGSYYEPSNLEPSGNIPFQTPPKAPELDKNITKPFTASPSCKKKSPKALSEITLEIERILKAECDARGITWEPAKEPKNIERLVNLIRDRGKLLSIVDKFIELTRAPSGFLSGKPPTASMLKATLPTVEAALSNSSEHQQLLRKAAQAFPCPKCGSQIIQGDIACPECGTLVQDIDGVTS